MNRILKRIDDILLGEGSFFRKDLLLEIKLLILDTSDVSRKKQPYATLINKHAEEIAEWLDTDVLIVKQKIKSGDFNPGEMKLIITNILLKSDSK